MERIYSLLTALLLVLIANAQSPDKFNYQAVIRNSDGSIRANQSVNIQIGILQGSVSNSPVYIETHSVTSTAMGLVNLIIGDGTVVSGSLSGIDWSAGPVYLKIWVDGAEMGTSQLLSVPYALYASGAGTAADAVKITGNQSIAGNKTFTGHVTVNNPVNDMDAANKSYVDSLRIRLNNLINYISYKFTDFNPTLVAHWKFENNTIDSVGGNNANAIIDINYVSSRNPASGMAAQFNGTTSLIEIPTGNRLESPEFTLSFWVKVDNTAHHQYQFIMGLGAFYGFQFEFDSSQCKLAASYQYSGGGDTTFADDLWFNGAANNSTKDNGGWQGWTYCKDLTSSGGVGSLFFAKWAHVVCTYKVATKIGTMYINGQKMKEQDFNLWPSGSKETQCTGLKYGGKLPEVKNDLAFGFIQSREGNLWADQSWGGYTFPGACHFKGLLDDIMIFNTALSATQVLNLYNTQNP
jgi:hypothetical protein